MSLTLMLDSSAAEVFCHSIDSDRQRIEDGTLGPDRFRFFEDGGWKIVRSSGDLTGCAAGVVALHADGNRSEAANANGYAVIDAFVESILNSDPNPVATKASSYAAAITHLIELLESQSRLLADFIPAPQGATREIWLPSSPEVLGQTALELMIASPSAAANLNVDGCKLYVEISSSPSVIDEAKNAGLSFAEPNRENGTVWGAFIAINTERVIGLERVDGTGVEALVNQAVVVRVGIIGNQICESAPEIVRHIFEDIIARNPAGFVRP
ncbi:hypothetical protein [Yoonia vestfoldensis]|uniref:hypothetical protein n=1 Tax=Yoonia vestfoldensis TaxID=245188 RepID=UPI0013A59734|nr:hypothetical protein [Yoonia vestfoldensis]